MNFLGTSQAGAKVLKIKKLTFHVVPHAHHNQVTPCDMRDHHKTGPLPLSRSAALPGARAPADGFSEKAVLKVLVWKEQPRRLNRQELILAVFHA